jgi:hypothetical protein
VDFVLEGWVSNEKLIKKLVNVILSLLVFSLTALRLLGLKANVMDELILHLILGVFPREVR